MHSIKKKSQDLTSVYTYSGTPPGVVEITNSHKKTPEMNELEMDNKILKIWAHNFEKQKS